MHIMSTHAKSAKGLTRVNESDTLFFFETKFHGTFSYTIHSIRDKNKCQNVLKIPDQNVRGFIDLIVFNAVSAIFSAI